MSLQSTRIGSVVGQERFEGRAELLEGLTYPMDAGGTVHVTAVDADQVETEYEGTYGARPIAFKWRFASQHSAKHDKYDFVGLTSDGRRWSDATGQSTDTCHDVDPETDRDKGEVPYELAQEAPHDHAVALMKAVWEKACGFVEANPERMFAASLFEAANALRRDVASRARAAAALDRQDERIAGNAAALEAGFARLEEMVPPSAMRP